MTPITTHFFLEEFACHDGTPYPSTWVVDRLHRLCEQLEVIRTALGAVIMIDSGYRTAEYNARLPGAATDSQHVHGRAADIRASGIVPNVVHTKILTLVQSGRVKIGGLGRYPTFVHVDVRPGDRLARWDGARVTNKIEGA